jgi:RHS repeat-associated protein
MQRSLGGRRLAQRMRWPVAMLYAGAMVAGCGGSRPPSPGADATRGQITGAATAAAVPPPATEVAVAVPEDRTPLVADSAGAKAILAGLRARLAAAARAGQAKGDASATDVEMLLAPGAAEGFKAASPSDSLRPSFAKSAPVPTARVTLPPRSKASVSIEDASSGTGVSFALMGSRDVAAQAAEGFVVYERAHVSGATVLHRALPEGVEDFLSFDTAPPGASVAYEVKLGEHAAGLRLVDNTLEVLDARGAPRLRVAPPYLVGADGARAGARLAVWGCQVDTNPAPPWGRAVTPPGAPSCRLEVSWEGRAVSYPALLDPSWRATTGAMSSLRHEHTATLLANGKVLVAGGRTSTGTSGSALNGLASAELFDPATRTWTGAGNMTGSTGMTGPRRLHAAVLLGATGNPTTAGKVLVAGGIHGSTTVNTASLYDPVGNSWTAAMVMNAARHQHTMTVLVDGRVLAVGGLNGTGVLNTAATYNPASGSGAWNGVTSNMPSARRAHTATRLSVPGNMTLHDKVIVVGGNSGGTTSLSTVLLFNGTNGWTTLPPLDDGTREGHAVALLPDGRLLVVGGRRVTSSLDTARIFNPATGTGSWASGGTMSTTRQNPTATALTPGVTAQGQVLVAGGWNSSGTRDTSQVYDVTAGWRTAAPMPPVQGHTATLLAGGKVLIAGGANGSTVQSASHLYDPSEGILCTTSSQCASGFCVDGVCCNSACDAGCGACNLAGSVGTCAPKPSASTCTPDGNDCTTDTCNGSSLACQHPPKSNGTTCEDGNYCTVGDTCQAGSCSNPGPLKTCAPTGQCRAAGTCDPDTGICSSPPLANGLSCSDGNRCTADDVCQMGTCLPGAWSTAMCPAGTPQFAVVTDLGVVEGEWSEAYDLNDAGEVVGYEYSPWRSTGRNLGFRYKPTGEMVPVRPDPALGQWGPASLVWSINASGTIAGGIPGGSDGFTQSSGGQVATYPLSGPLRDINDSGHVAGTYYAPHPEEGYYPGAAVRHRQPQAPSSPFDMLAAGTPFEFTGSEARAIDSSGSIVAGVYGIPLDDVPPQFRDIWRMNLRPFIHRPSEGTHDLNDDPVVLPSGWTLVGAWDMKGPFVVGQGIHDGEVRGYRYHTGDRTLVEIGTLPEHPWKTRSWAEGVNAAGAVVGSVFAANAGESADLIAPWVYTPDGRQYDLNDFIDPASGWSLRAANAINNQNEVAGWGFHGTSKRAFKMKLPAGIEVPSAENSLVLRVDGVVEDSPGSFVAVFGYNNISTTTWQIPLGPSTNALWLNGAPVADPKPRPPTTFQGAPGPGRIAQRPASFLPKFAAGSAISWKAAGQTVGASESSPRLNKVPIEGGGYGVMIGGQLMTVRPSSASFTKPPAPPVAQGYDPAVGNVYKGTLAGQLSVSPTGAATYTVPIGIPPGIAGMAPNLSLVYSSQGGNGVAGQGWELAGLSVIHRCEPTVGQDGDLPNPGQPFNGPICLDGKRLVQTSWDPVVSTAKFETEQKSFAEIVWLSSTGFQIRTKSGERRYYGRSSNSRVSLSPNELASIWALDRVMDMWGNYFDIQYNGSANVLTEGFFVTKIDYTGNIPTSTPPFYQLTFEYESRTDVRSARIAGISIPRKQRLSRIVSPRGAYFLHYSTDAELRTSSDRPPVVPISPSRLWRIDYCKTGSSPVLPAGSGGSGGGAGGTGGGSDGCLDPLIFDWDSVDIKWERANGSTPGLADWRLPAPIDVTWDCDGSDCERNAPGTQLVDLNADGRLDFVLAKEGEPHKTWENTGNGWTLRPDWKLPDGPPDRPLFLASSSGKIGAYFGDVNGDGFPDVIGICTGDCPPIKRSPSIYHNKIKTNEGWQGPGSGGWIVTPTGGQSCCDFDKIDLVTDMNGDGLVDLVSFGPNQWTPPGQLRVLHGEKIWWRDVSARYAISINFTPVTQYHLKDVNQDGLPDLVRNSDNYTTAAPILNPNTLKRGPNYSVRNAVDDVSDLKPWGQKVADIDGDGLHDVVSYFEEHGPPKVALGTGTGYTTNGAADFLAELMAVRTVLPSSSAGSSFVSWHHVFNIVDLNADGLPDLVWNRPARGGQLFINTGTTWRNLFGLDCPAGPDSNGFPHCIGVPADRGGTDSYQDVFDPGPGPVPLVPWEGRHYQTGAVYIDLDGDGVTDVASPTDSWLNRFRRPVIKRFPNGVATKTEVSYLSISSADARSQNIYTDSAGPLEEFSSYSDTRRIAMPLQVVTSVSADDGVGSRAMTKYAYSSLRVSPFGRGMQGFREVTVTDPSGMTTTTTYGQRYPYTGLPISVRRSIGGGDVSLTETTYCDRPLTSTDQCSFPTVQHPPPRTPVFIYPARVTDTNYLRRTTGAGGVSATATETLVTTTELQYDEAGNPTLTTVKTASYTGATKTEEHKKEIENRYGSAIDIENRFLGHVTWSKTTARRLYPTLGPENVHIIEADYRIPYIFAGGAPLALGKKKVEPQGGQGITLHTVYDYDRFGNVITTLECASDFDDCTLEASSSFPFRKTQVSYDTALFVAPSGTGVTTVLGYGPGRYPVRTTNAAGHEAYTAYDPFLGVLLQTTGSDGVTTCQSYDPFGRSTSQTARCGSAAPLVTTFTPHFSIDPSISPLAKLVTVTRPPVGAPTWMFADALDRTIDTRTRSFSGAISRTARSFNPLGQVVRETKPHLLYEPEHATELSYDILGRVWRVVDDLASIDGSAASTFSEVKTFYEGMSVRTERQVEDLLHKRTETKNVLGKVAEVRDSLDGKMSYRYDGDGNLTDSIVNGSETNKVVTTYDVRGRKTSTTDPDMGYWRYVPDGFGDLVSQFDARNVETKMTYDKLGRLTSKEDPAGVAYWVYDVAEGAGVGKLAAVISAPDQHLDTFCSIPNAPAAASTGNRTGRWFKYTSFGELQEESECIDGETFVTAVGYDEFARKSRVTYPAIPGASPLVVAYRYTTFGHLHYIAEPGTTPAADSVYWAANEMNAAGQVTRETTRNGVETISSRNPSTGWLMSTASSSLLDGGAPVNEWSFTYNVVGSLRGRWRVDPLGTADAQETFVYDALDRLTQHDTAIPTLGYTRSEAIQYDGIGNIRLKGGRTYTYTGCQAGPHAVCNVTGSSPYSYDANGRMLNGDGRTVDYNHQGKPTRIARVGTPGAVEFAYGANGDRVVQEAAGASGGATERTVYVGMGATGKSAYERTERGGETEHVQFIYAGDNHGGSAVAMRMLTTQGTSSPTATTKFNHFDHLGSITAVTDDLGRLAGGTSGPEGGLMNYDAWGARREPDGRAAPAASFPPPVGRRTFTGHEAMPSVGLINMNGRVYDPDLGRFLSPDPLVPFSADLQSYNRYSYVLNNPLRYTDPTGHAPSFQSIAVGVLFTAAYVGCAATPGCGPTVAIIHYWYILATLPQDATFGQVVLSVGVGLASSSIGGNVGGAVGGAIGGRLGGLVGGAVGGAVSSGIQTLAAGDYDHLGRNMLEGAAVGAAMAGVAWAAESLGSPSEAALIASREWNSPAMEAAATEIKAVGTQKFQVLKRSNGRIHAFFFGEEYQLTEEAVGFYQPIYDRALKGTGYHLDVSSIRFKIDSSIVGYNGEPVDGRWVGGKQVLLRNLPNQRFVVDFRVVAHEMFHIAQGLVAGGGNLALGYQVGRAGIDAGVAPRDWRRASTRFDLISPAQTPYEDAARVFSERLYNAFY